MRRKPKDAKGQAAAANPMVVPTLIDTAKEVKANKPKLANDAAPYLRRAASIEFEIDGDRVIIHNGPFAHQTLGEILGAPKGKDYLAGIYALVPNELKKAITRAFTGG
jgi:hypothetical protein